jgi:hypothetical protein
LKWKVISEIKIEWRENFVESGFWLYEGLGEVGKGGVEDVEIPPQLYAPYFTPFG